MSDKLKKLLVYAVANDVIKTFIMIFLNLYVWTKEQSIAQLVLFNFVTYIIWAIVFPIGVNLVHKRGVKYIYRLSAITNIMLFVGIIALPQGNIERWIVMVAMLHGLTRSIYSSGKNVAVSIMAEKREISLYHQYEVLFTRVAQVVTPIMFGAIIYFTSYTVMFVGMLLYSLFLFVLVEKLEDIKNEEKELDLFSDFFSVFKKGNKRIKLLPLSYLMGGTFSEFHVIFISIFTFSITSNQLGVALLNVMYSLIIMLLIKINSRYAKVKGYVWLYIGATLGFVGFGMMYFDNYYLLILANVLLVSGTFYYSTTYYSQQLEVIQGLEELEKMKMVIFREVGLLLSRTLFLGLILIMEIQQKEEIAVVMFVVIAMTMTVPSIHKKMLKKEN